MNITALPNTCHDNLPDAVLKSSESDFRVDEVLGFDPSGDGEHLWVNICKQGLNTRDVIELIARLQKIPARDIGYSGLKDRHAVTTQWMSIPLAKVSDRQATERDIAAQISEQSGLECLQVCRSQKKLKTGTHRKNKFHIVLRDIRHPTEQMHASLAQLATKGFPNYFGSQRFGREGGNVVRARSMMSGDARVSRFKRGIYLSAARAYLFNVVLAKRVQEDSWNKIIDGELCVLDGTNSVFQYDGEDQHVHHRCTELDIHPSGPLHGRGNQMISGGVSELESSVMAAEKELAQGLERAGLKSERRALRAVPTDFHSEWIDNETLALSFMLPRGVYATSLLAEIASVHDAGGNIVQSVVAGDDQ